MKPIIEVKGLWKQYRRGAQKEAYLSLRDRLVGSLKSAGKKETFWALENINFDVYPGDSLAIIGKNGAGKSTLLKILSRITPPTKGEIILRGRLASLLEVGTGFHQELTGRENVYLNGSILGLGRKEINRQFDAIVDFSGVEAFLDTPLKHYSSGMQLRLAFAVAAHLEPEILVIDEVLAVGDSAFQQKCIEKMTEVSNSGRTLLFVSHNMQAVKNLCKKGVYLEDGRVKLKSDIESIIQSYNGAKQNSAARNDLRDNPNRRGSGELQFSYLLLPAASLQFGESIRIGLQLQNNKNIQFNNLDFGVAVRDMLNNNLMHLSNKFIGSHTDHKSDQCEYWFESENILKPGKYQLVIFIRANDVIQDWIEDAGRIEITQGNRYNYANGSEIQGLVQPDFNFLVRKEP